MLEKKFKSFQLADIHNKKQNEEEKFKARQLADIHSKRLERLTSTTAARQKVRTK